MFPFILPLFIVCLTCMGIIVVADTSDNISTHSLLASNLMCTATDKSQISLAHHHEVLDVSGNERIPSLALAVQEDSSANGWNIHILTENFKFSPEHVNQQHVENEGHAHIFIDNKKVARAYSEWNYVSDLSPGPHTITVTLNSNDHRELSANKQKIEASYTIVQKDNTVGTPHTNQNSPLILKEGK